MQFIFQNLRPIITFLALLLVSSSWLSAQFDYVGRYNAETLEVRIFMGDMEEEIILIREEDGIIWFRPRSARTGAEIGRPLEEIVDVYFMLPRDFTLAWEKMRDNPEQALEGMRPFVYALMRYQHFRSGNLFPILNQYLRALIRLEKTSEAIYFLRNIRLRHASAEFLNTTLEFTQTLVQADRRTDAIGILNRIPFNSENVDLLEVVLNFAHDLRRRDNFVEANFLYGQLIGVEDNPFRNWAVLWHIYGDVKLNRTTAAKVFLDRYMPEAPSNMSPEYSLYQLIQGRLHLKDEKSQEAIMDITRGVVFASLDSEWTAELFYLNGEGYELLGQIQTARQIYNTIRLFYPNSPWADRAYDRMITITPGFLEAERAAAAEAVEEELLLDEEGDLMDEGTGEPSSEEPSTEAPEEDLDDNAQET